MHYNKAAIGKPLEIANSDITGPMRLQLIICHKNSSFLRFLL